MKLGSVLVACALAAVTIFACTKFSSTSTGPSDEDGGADGSAHDAIAPRLDGGADANGVDTSTDAGCDYPVAFCDNFDDGQWSTLWSAASISPELAVEMGDSTQCTTPPFALVYNVGPSQTNSTLSLHTTSQVIDCALDMRLDAAPIHQADVIQIRYGDQSQYQATYDFVDAFWQNSKNAGSAQTKAFPLTPSLWARFEIRLDAQAGNLTYTVVGTSQSLKLSVDPVAAPSGIDFTIGGIDGTDAETARFDTLRCTFK